VPPAGAPSHTPGIRVAVNEALAQSGPGFASTWYNAKAATGHAVTELPMRAESLLGEQGTTLTAVASTPDMGRYAGGTLVSSTNGFVDAVRMAYNHHATLRLRADDVWLQVRALWREGGGNGTRTA
jgi:hypothetical protein